MSQVNETSRLSQLTPAGLQKLVDGMAANSLNFSVITQEISEKIAAMSDSAHSEGMDWYAEANDFATQIADEFNTTVEITAGVIAAVSPRMPWLRNKSVARFVFQNLSKIDGKSALEGAKELKVGLFSNLAMAIKIARGEDISNILTGTKRRSFYNNIVSPNTGDSVTVDTWMVRAIMNTTGVDLKTASDLLRINRVALGGTGVGYYVIAEAVRNVAKDMNILPCQVQALYWIAISGSANGGREDIA